MNGRVYDAEIGRFISADPFIQDRTNLQALNRYSYVQNNPLSYTDPSGFFLKKLFKKFGKAINAVVSWFAEQQRHIQRKIFRAIGKVKWLSTAISVGLSFTPCSAACVIAFNAAMADAHGASFGNVLKGAAVAMVLYGVPGPKAGGFWKSGLMGKISSLTNKFVGAVVTGGISSKAMGGKFIDGVKGGAIGYGISEGIDRLMVGDKVEVTAEDGGPGETPPNTDVPPEANPKLAGKVYDKDGQLNIDVTVRNGSPTVGPKLSDNAFNRQLDAVRTDFAAVDVNVNFTAVDSGPADLVYFSGPGNGYSSSLNAISYTDSGVWNGTSSHEFMHFLTGRGHAPNPSGSIRSYAHNRSVTRRDAQIIRGLYGQ